MDVRALRRLAIGHTMASEGTLSGALDRLGFVQADPIRAPARAQDLILRHRVRGYRAGDLERRYARLPVDEVYLYAYGFMPEAAARLLLPRFDPDSYDGRHVPAGLATDVLAAVQAAGVLHPRDLQAAFGRDRAVNGWGGFSKATTQALDMLLHHGYLRVARREDGIRLYAARPLPDDGFSHEERLRRLVMIVARVLAPVPAPTLSAAASRLARELRSAKPPGRIVAELLESGALERHEVDGLAYLWPTYLRPAPVHRRVRFLAPFDPLVWDRRRFEHLWGWRYRFEAYTPPARRRLGYYAMPMLWGEAIIGWVNCSVRAGRLEVVPGYLADAPAGRDFRSAFDAEVAAMADFLAVA